VHDFDDLRTHIDMPEATAAKSDAIASANSPVGWRGRKMFDILNACTATILED
jgi:uncharacterized protein YcgI (DUF1989 family)